MARRFFAKLENRRRARIGVPAMVLSAAIAWLFAITAAAASTPDAAPEYTIKAGYLLLFARYTHWSDSAFSAADSPLIVAVIGNDPFGVVLDEAFRDQRVGLHPIEILRAAKPEEALRAHLVFVSAAHRNLERRWLEPFRGRHVLTVGESAESLDAGAIVRLVEDRGKVRFDVDWRSAAQSALQIASPMLVSARRTRGTPPNIGSEVTQ